MNFIKDYKRILTTVLFEGKLFEDITNNEMSDNATSVVREKVNIVARRVVWEVFITGVEIEDFSTRVEFDYEENRLRAILYFKKNLYNRLFGNLVPDQKSRELARLINALEVAMDDVDWAQIILDVEVD